MTKHEITIKTIWLGLLGMVLLAGCSVEEDLEPSGIESGYLVPQGDNDYDDIIVDYYQRYGSNLLYEFTDKDAYWTPGGWDNGTAGPMDSIGEAGFYVSRAEEDYLLKQLNLLEETWFQYYSDEFLQKYLPVKILLCNKVEVMDYDYSSWPFSIAATAVPGYFHYDQISVSHASDTIDSMTHADSLAYSLALHRELITSMVDRGVTEPTEEFTSLVNYSSVSSLYTNSEIWAVGSFQPYYSASASADWEIFLMMMVSYSEDYLTREPSYISEYDYTESAWEGILHSSKDSNGLLKQRYDLVRNYFIDNYNTDLQLIGNAME